MSIYGETIRVGTLSNTGDKGPDGHKGPDGDKGPDGYKGPDGDKGPDGTGSHRIITLKGALTGNNFNWVRVTPDDVLKIESETIKNSLRKSIWLMYELTVSGWPTATDTSILYDVVGAVVIDVDVDGVKSTRTGDGTIGRTRVQGFTIVPSGKSISMSLNESTKKISRKNHAIELKCIVAQSN